MTRKRKMNYRVLICVQTNDMNMHVIRRAYFRYMKDTIRYRNDTIDRYYFYSNNSMFRMFKVDTKINNVCKTKDKIVIFYSDLTEVRL